MRTFKGIGASPGVAIGRAFIIKSTAGEDILSRPFEGKAAELARLESALMHFRTVTRELADRLDREGGDGDILRGHVMMTEDPFMVAGMKERIEKGQNAAAAAAGMCEMFAAVFEGAEDELTRQRAADVRDVRDRLLRILAGERETDISDIPSETVLILEELTPSMTALVDRSRVVGFVTVKGGMTSHAAILARAMGLPAVLGVANAVTDITPGATVGIDGNAGELCLDPNGETLAAYSALAKARAVEAARLEEYRGKVTMTADGVRKELLCNIGSDREVSLLLENDGEGVGLFRTEFLFMNRSASPDEEAQFAAYRAAAVALCGRPLIVRTLDVGGDKKLPYFDMGEEENPFLGYRALRFCLQNPKLWGQQLRAVLRASAFGDLRILLPMVTCMEELREAKSLIGEAQAELRAKGIAHHAHLPVGVMIETPAAAAIAELLAREVDFFSIGTNDLTQYVMAADRGNSRVSDLNTPYHPAVLRTIEHVIAAANEAGIPVGVCGEAAADPLLTPLFLAFGLSEFSVSPAAVLRVRAEIARWRLEDARALADEIMSLTEAREVKKKLEKAQLPQ